MVTADGEEGEGNECRRKQGNVSKVVSRVINVKDMPTRFQRPDEVVIRRSFPLAKALGMPGEPGNVHLAA